MKKKVCQKISFLTEAKKKKFADTKIEIDFFGGALFYSELWKEIKYNEMVESIEWF